MSESPVPHAAEPSISPMEAPESSLERMYIEAYLQRKGYTLHSHELILHSIGALPTGEAKRLMTEASAYASIKLTEVETRAHFIEEIHGTSAGHPA